MGLIASNTLLFVGYSFNDPDLRQMFHWVKSILGADFQRAYLIDSFHEYDDILQYILNDDRSENEIDEIYKKVKPLDTLHFILRKDIVQVFREYGLNLERKKLIYRKTVRITLPIKWRKIKRKSIKSSIYKELKDMIRVLFVCHGNICRFIYKRKI